MSGVPADLATDALEAFDQFLEIADLSDPERAARLHTLRDLFAEQVDLATAGAAPVEGTVATLDD